MQWYNAIVNYRNKKIIYYAPRFKKDLDVLNREKCLFNKYDGELIVANFSIEKIQPLSFFPIPQLSIFFPFRLGIIISNDLKKEVVKAGLTGIDFYRLVNQI